MSLIDETTAPRRGRPRSADADAAILKATLDLAGEVGINGMSMDVLAARAGVSKTTIYRRWPSKEALVLAALGSAIRPFDDVDTGTLRDDLDLYLGELVERYKPSPMNDILPHLIEAASLDQSVQTSLDSYVHIRRQPLHTIFDRALTRGELDADTDVDLLIDAVIGPFVYRRLLTREPVNLAFVERLLQLVLPTIFGSNQ